MYGTVLTKEKLIRFLVHSSHLVLSLQSIVFQPGEKSGLELNQDIIVKWGWFRERNDSETAIEYNVIS